MPGLAIDVTGETKIKTKVIPEFDPTSIEKQVAKYPVAEPFKQEYIPEDLKTQNSEVYTQFSPAILQEFCDVLPQITRHLQAMGETISKITQNKTIETQTVQKELTQNVIQNDNTQPLQPELNFNEQNQRELTQNTADAIKDNAEAYKDSTTNVKELDNVLPEIIKNFRYMNSVVAQTASSLPAVGKIKTSEEQKKIRKEDLERQGLLSIFNSGSNTVSNLASGNVAGAGLGVINAGTNLLNNTSNLAKNAEMTDLASSLLKMGVITSIAGLVFKGADSLSEKYIEEMPTIYGTGRAFGSMDNFDSMISWEKINEYNKGTNLDIDTFQNIAQSLRKQGLGNDLAERDEYGRLNITPESKNQMIKLVGNVVETTSQWAYATGGDANQYANLAGLMSRYGGSQNVAEDFNYLIASGKAQGLNDSQIPEFLSGIQKVMEDGIAKGFTRSAVDVAQTMLMFSKMSGGSAYWQSEKGAQMINQMNSGVAGATSLSKTSDILTYQAFRSVYKDDKSIEDELNKDKSNKTYIKGGSYVNTMQLIEQGVNNAETFSAIMQSAKNASGGDVNAEVEFLRDIFGLNYTGVGKLMNLDLSKIKNNDELEAKLKEITEDPNNLTKETQYQEAMNTIKSAVVAIGDKTAALKIDGLSDIAVGVDAIKTFLLGTTEEKEIIKDFDTKYETLTPEQKRELNEIMPTFASSQEKLSWTKWYMDGQAGMPEGINKTNIFTDYSQGKLKSKIKWKEGSSWNDIEKLKDFTNQEYGDEILAWVGGDVDKKNEIVDKLINDPMAKGYREKVVRDTDDKKIDSNEEKQTVNLLKQILTVLGYPITVTQNVPR